MPQTVAVIGASSDRAKFGNKAVRAFRQRGYTVWPVNPHEMEIDGLPAEVWLNPGSESDELIARARALGVEPITACSIVGIGMSPYGL
jgi:acyl-CoA synthetase (NDP forming)